MTRKWKPGDVAMVTFADARRLSMRMDSGWFNGDGSWSDATVHEVEPLVVIDPDDREQVEFVIDAYVNVMAADGRSGDKRGAVLKMQAALRSLVADPKPEEPTGLGAVVEDADGLKWIRVVPSIGYFYWQSADTERRAAKWAGIAAIKILSDGVTA